MPRRRFPTQQSRHLALDRTGSAILILGQALSVRPWSAEFSTFEYLQRVHGLPFTIMTPVKKHKGQEYLEAADAWISRAVSQVRQPIESIFNWIEEKYGIEMASKVLSYQGLLVHVFGRLAAAMFVRNVLTVSA